MKKQSIHRPLLNRYFSIWNQKFNNDRIRIAFNIHPKRTPFGGANEFIKQISSFAAWNACEIVYELDPRLTHIFIADVRKIENCTFSLKEIYNFKKKFPHVRVIHRVNNCDKKYSIEELKRPEVAVDQKVLEISSWVDYSVFVSEWVRDYFYEKGFPKAAPHEVIPNAAEDTLFFPERLDWDGRNPLKLVTHHWSNNWMKGFRVYQQIDEMIASKEISGFELTIVGRWPNEIQWKTARTLPPMQGIELANELRSHHLYVTASLYEPGGMHFVEGMQCGLPMIYHKDGGAICCLSKHAGVAFDQDVKAALLEARERYTDLRKKVLLHAPSGKKFCEAFFRIINEL